MFSFISKWFLGRKAKKITSYIDSIETQLTLFYPIEHGNKKIEKMLLSLSQSVLYADLVSRCNVCFQKIENHNREIQSLSFTYNTL